MRIKKFSTLCVAAALLAVGFIAGDGIAAPHAEAVPQAAGDIPPAGDGAEPILPPIGGDARPEPVTGAAPKPDGLWPWPGEKYRGDFADPFVLPVQEASGTVYYAYATNTGHRKLPVMKSTDLETWTVTSYSSDLRWSYREFDESYDPLEDPAIPSEIREFRYQRPGADSRFVRAREAWFNADGLVSPRPSWAQKINQNLNKPGDYGWLNQENWAPGVAFFNGKYHAYFAVHAKSDVPSNGPFCIALATSEAPGGPFRYERDTPVLCPKNIVDGVIDPEPFAYQGKWYLLWKTENDPKTPQGIYAQEINPSTGYLRPGSPTTLLTRNPATTGWEQHAIENPSMATIGGVTYLFYSGGKFWSDGYGHSPYATGYAVCPQGPLGPCTRGKGDNRLLASHGGVEGPGGGSVVRTADGAWKLAYHAYRGGDTSGRRYLRFANIYTWNGGAVAIADGERPRFADVPDHQPFKRQILWLADQGITTGDKGGTFRPWASTNRAAMAAFLYRYSGSPAYTPKGASPFADVDQSTQFYKEIRWMYDAGLSTGVHQKTGKPLYKPKQAISREAMAAFFYRMSGVKNYQPKSSQPLVDITKKSKFYREIRWMYDNGITTGKNLGGGKFRYDEKGQTKRDAFAAFLMRYDAKFGK